MNAAGAGTLSSCARILIVEDDDDLREALLMTLEQLGHVVFGARHGQEALELLRGQARPDLILLDLMMPVMDGWQFRKAQLADPALAMVPVCVVSATPPLSMPGVARVFAKPIRLDQLESVVCDCLAGVV